MKKWIALGTMFTMAALTACGGGAKETTAAATSAESKAEETKAAETKAEETKAAETKAEETKAAGGATEISFWTYPVGTFSDQAVVDGLIASFNQKYPDIKVSVQLLDYQSGDDQVNTAIEGKQAPDIIFEGPERLVANWGAKGYMVDLADLYTSDAAKEIYPNVAAACKSTDGKYFEYPLVMVAHSMAINKKMFEEANALQYLDLENHTWTTENFLKAVQAVYDSGQTNVLAMYCQGQGGDQGTRALVNNLYSGTYTDPAHTKYTLDSEQNVKALETLKKQAGVNFDAGIVGGDEIKLFRQGIYSMSLCWNAAMQIAEVDGAEAGKTLNGDEIIPMLFPSDDGKTELCGGIWGFGIFDNGDAAKIEAAKKFIDFMANDEAQVKNTVAATGFFPVRPSVKDVYAGTPKEAAMATFEKYFIPSMGDYYQVVPGWPTARTEWWNMLQRIGTGDGSNVKAEVDTFIANANKAAEEAAK